MTDADAPTLVIDTNWVLDLWVFDDPRTTALKEALAQPSVRWVACTPMRDELERVLAYPNIQKGLNARQHRADEVLTQFDRNAQLVPAAASCTVRCADHDDQVFIDLAAEHRAVLISKDLLVLKLRRKLQPWGVQVVNAWPVPTAGL